MRFRDVEREVDPSALTSALDRIGAQPGHRIASFAGNTPLAAALHLAAREMRLVVVPARDEGDVAGCDAVVTSGESGSGLPFVTADDWGQGASSSGRIAADTADSESGYLVATSGTIAAKRVLITHAMLASHRLAARTRLGESADARWALVLPLHRIGGIALLDRALAHGMHLTMTEPARLGEELRHATHASLVPTMLHRLLKGWNGPPPEASLLLGGDAAPESLVRAPLQAGWRIWCTYGLTEASSQVATATPEERLAHPGTSGRPLDGVRVRVVDGEIEVSGPTVVGGGPFATGDLGQLHEGRLTVLGRRDDRITTGGIKVDPVEVEEVLRQHPDVRDAAVVGLPSEEWGQRVVAFVVADRTLDLGPWSRARLSAPCVPKEFRFISSIPRTPEGKIRRAALRQGTVPT